MNPHRFGAIFRVIAPTVTLVAAGCMLGLSTSRAAEPLRTQIDRLIAFQTADYDKLAAPIASDEEFLRRIYLDLVGTIPTFDEATGYLNESDPKKRDKLIEKLLADPRFAAQQAHVWDLVLFGRRPGNIDATRKRDGFKTWLADRDQSFRDNVQVVAMDGFTGFKTATAEELPDAVAVMDPFHAVRLAGDAMDECRRRVQQAIHGHRGRAGDPLYTARRTLHTDKQRERIREACSPPTCSPTSIGRGRATARPRRSTDAWNTYADQRSGSGT